jgi:hypothetical protein
VSSLPEGFSLKDRSSEHARAARDPIDWTRVLTDTNGAQGRLSLSRDSLLYPQIVGKTLRIGALTSTASSEIVFRRYQYPIKDFAAANPHLHPDRLHSIRFDFDRSARGAIVLSDVGLAKIEPAVALAKPP